VLGGLVSSTILNLFVLPALARHYIRIPPPRALLSSDTNYA
jgi:Cu/Ag efflux pump CusA